MSTPAVQLISECFVNLQHPTEEICHLSPWDVLMLSSHYIQQGLLFKKPSPLRNHQDFMQNLLDKLKHSLSLALSHFYPLAGRLVTHKTQEPPSYVVSIDCINTSGAKFIYATLDLSVADILSPIDVPPIVQTFFDHDRALNHDGHTMSLLSIQVTELVDGVFIGCSMNHCIADGTSYWNFFNTWSQIFQAHVQAQGHEHDVPISNHPIHNRWFPYGCGPPFSLPFKHHGEFVARFEAPKLRERIFHFSAESLSKLKAKANSESNTTKISSFQSLSALVWRSITRARGLPYDKKTSCSLTINNRSRIEPAMAEEYFGNMIQTVGAETMTGDLLEGGLGYAAWKVHLAVTSHNNEVIEKSMKKWLESPFIYQVGRFFDPHNVAMNSLSRFNMYGNEFGMGKAVAVRSGYASKLDGYVTSYPSHEGGGSIDLEVCLLPHTMSALELDHEFMNAVSVSNPLC